MERSAFVLALVSLVTASPHGYGAKSAAVARAEASAGAGVLPVIPLDSPGFSGSYSKSSSSSFASSSASSSSSSSSFSFSGTGSNLIPGFGSNGLSGPGCTSGVCDGKNELGSNGQGANGNAAQGGHYFNGATAGAQAVANTYNNNNQPCTGTNCNDNNNSGKKCPSGQCTESDNTKDNNQNNKCTSGACDKSANSGSTNNGDNSQTQNDKSSNGINNAANKPQVPNNAESNNRYFNNGQNSPSSSQPHTPTAPGTKDNDANNQSPECDTPDCDYFIPSGSGLNKDNTPSVMKPSPNLETPYHEIKCTTHDCISESPNTNSGKPSSYNVPILGVNSENSYKPAKGVNVPQNSGQNPNQPPRFNPSFPPTGPISNVNQNCASGNCVNPSNPPYEPPESGKDYNCPSGNCASSAYQPNTNGPVNYPSFPSNTPGNSNVNPSWKPNSQTGPLPSIPSYQPNVQTSPNGYPNQPKSVGSPSLNPAYQPSGTENSAFIPNEQTKPNSNPSYPQNTPYGSGNAPHCSSGNCNGNGLFLNKNTKTPSLPQNPTGSTYNNGKTSSQDQITGTQIQGCSSPNCAIPSGSRPESGSSIHVTGPGKANPNDTPQTSTFNSPSNSPSQEPSVLLSNNGNQIYSGGFGGSDGVLSAPQAGKPNTNGISPSNSGIPQSPSYASNGQFKPDVSSVPQPGNIGSFIPNSNPSNGNNGYGGPKPSTQQPSASGNGNLNRPQNTPTLGPNNGHPASDHSTNDQDKPAYTGGFGGPPGLLKPNEHTLPATGQNPVCSNGGCGGNKNNNVGSPTSVAVASADAVAYSGGFGGPPGLLKPYDGGKGNVNSQQGLSKNNLGQNGGAPAISNGIDSQNPNHALNGAHASAVATASASAVGGNYGPSGGCNSGCANGKDGSKNESNPEGQIAKASATAKSVAYSQAGSVASAHSHASAGASVKGGYSWK